MTDIEAYMCYCQVTLTCARHCDLTEIEAWFCCPHRRLQQWWLREQQQQVCEWDVIAVTSLLFIVHVLCLCFARPVKLGLIHTFNAKVFIS